MNPKLGLHSDVMNKLIVILLALSLFAVTEFQISDVLAKPNEKADVESEPSDTKPKDTNVEDSTGKKAYLQLSYHTEVRHTRCFHLL